MGFLDPVEMVSTATVTVFHGNICQLNVTVCFEFPTKVLISLQMMLKFELLTWQQITDQM